MNSLDQLYNEYKNQEPYWENPLGEFIFMRTYARRKEDGTRENWSDCIYRVVKNIFNVLIDKGYDLNDFDCTPSEMFELFWYQKALPGGRSLFASTSQIIDKIGSYALNNCCAYNINSYLEEPSEFFYHVCNLLMVGCGVGFYCNPDEIIEIYKPQEKRVLHIVDDSRDGWCQSIKTLLNSYFKPSQNYVIFNYSHIRPKGTPLKVFGGVASGYEVLKQCHDRIRKLLENGDILTSRLTTDICCCIASMVVAGNIRRSSLLALMERSDKEMINIKDFENPTNDYRSGWCWCSNNSVKVNSTDTDFKDILKLSMKFGEPALIIHDNIRKYGRMIDPPDYHDDHPETMINPCSEAVLSHESGELCNLSEVFLTNISNLEEFEKCLRYAFFYCKVVSMISTKNEHSDKIIQKNRRVGVSLSGIHEFVCFNGIENLKSYLKHGYQYLKEYDILLSKNLELNVSCRRTVIQPSGTKSNMLGIFGSSINRPMYRYFIRRVRVQESDDLLPMYEKAGYEIEIDCCSQNTKIICFPVHVPNFIKLHTNDMEGMIYDLEMLVLLQSYYADQAVSHTITIPSSVSLDQLNEIVKKYAKKVKSLCFMPSENRVYKQAPIEPISKERYDEMTSKITKIDFTDTKSNIMPAYFGCDGEKCVRM